MTFVSVTDTEQASTKTFCAGLFNGKALSSGYQYSGSTCTAAISGGCSMQAPNGASVDGIINVYTHEIWEALSNTYGAWFRSCDGYENADICNNNYGIISVSGDSISNNKINYNLQLNGNNYLVQHNWLRANPYYTGHEKCGISADGAELNNNSLSTAATYLIYFALLAIPCCLACIIYMMCCVGNAHGQNMDDKMLPVGHKIGSIAIV
jgi:hypothetical protein